MTGQVHWLPFVILLLAIVGAAVVFRWLWHASGARLRASRYNNLVASHDNGPVGRAFQASHRQELIAFAAIVGAMFVWLLWLAWPTLLWVGGGPDITHHLVLIDYIERQWQLSRDVVSDPYLGDMVYYTPGSHLLIALAGAWTRTDGLHALYPVVAFTVALKAGFVFLIALRLLPAGLPRTPIAVGAVLLLLLPRAYFLGSFTEHSFIAQVVAELFAVVMLWALVVWEHDRWIGALVLFAFAGMATFLTWPIWIGPPLTALAASGVPR